MERKVKNASAMMGPWPLKPRLMKKSVSKMFTYAIAKNYTYNLRMEKSLSFSTLRQNCWPFFLVLSETATNRRDIFSHRKNTFKCNNTICIHTFNCLLAGFSTYFGLPQKDCML
ncbi:hypothetical protein PanWU01x14_120570 [Parasponia andersonii]|uniref:Uncharacterized protein n=1 Tax=Parasponia andersonii TaxID=3476 RepID=A0A2P5CV00_PARAD|nr:hypothetical protein PanWU01x14_120570 [Parasponia andersonii]